ncbi:hypothetical protein BH09PAT4_BH09PAT4_02570 [soil metagenome]
MAPKQNSDPQNQPHDEQGEMFPVVVSRLHPAQIGEVTEGGVYPSELPAEETEMPFTQALHEAAAAEAQTRARRQAQQSKHSPLVRDGTYLTARPGDVLPGFGIVTYKNLESAKGHAKGLEQTRLARLAEQPTLTSPEDAEQVKAAVEQTADALDIRHGLQSPEPVPLTEVVAAVAEQRQRSIAARTAEKEAATAKRIEGLKNTSKRGGAFGGALKRRIIKTDSDEMRARTIEHDINLITAPSLRAELFPKVRGDLVYAGVLFTPTEYGAITISPEEVGRRVGANVLKHTADRPATERHARRDEVVGNDLQKRTAVAQETLVSLNDETDQIQRLRKEMKSPGYAHMTLDEMDGLMRTTEEVFIKMFQAIVENRGLGTERTESLTAAMQYLVAKDDYKATFKFWQEMSSLAQAWTDAKIQRFIPITERLNKELEAKA